MVGIEKNPAYGRVRLLLGVPIELSEKCDPEIVMMHPKVWEKLQEAAIQVSPNMVRKDA